MPLINVGLNRDQLDRVPYVTYAFIGLLVLSRLFVMFYFNAEKDLRSAELFQEILEFYIPRSDYLELSGASKQAIDAGLESMRRMYNQFEDVIEDDIEAEFGEDADFDSITETIMEQMRASFIEQGVEFGDPDDEQAHLDNLTQELGEVDFAFFLFRYGYAPGSPSAFGLFTHVFMVGDFILVFFLKILLLYIFLSLFESRFGHVMAGVYAYSGAILAAFLDGLTYSSSLSPRASFGGMLTVLMGAALVYAGKDKLAISFTSQKVGAFTMPSWVLIAIWAGFIFFGAIFQLAFDFLGEATGLVSLYGFLVGGLSMFALRATGVDERFFPKSDAIYEEEEDEPLTAALREERLGNGASALKILRDATKRFPDDLDLLQNYWRVASELRRVQDMIASGQKLMQNDIETDQVRMAHVRFKEIEENAPNSCLSPSFAAKVIRALVTESYFVEAQNILKHTYKNMPNPNVRLLMPLMELAADLQSEVGLEIADTLREQPDFDSHDLLDSYVETIEHGLKHGSELQNASVELSAGSESIALADAHEFDGFDTAPKKNVHSLKTYIAVPQAMDDKALTLLVGGKSQKRTPYSAIKAIAVGAIREPGKKPVLLIDLIFDRLVDVGEHHRVLRMRSSDFNPIKLMPQMNNPKEAFKRFVDLLLRGSGAEAYPSKDEALGNAYRNFRTLREYEKTIYYE